MIKKITLSPFKSFDVLELSLAQFSCLVGMNGSGKSSVLQAIDFVAQMMRGDIKGWFEKRGWAENDIQPKFSPEKSYIYISVEMQADSFEDFVWTATFDMTSLSCVEEEVKYATLSEPLFFKNRGEEKYTIFEDTAKGTIHFHGRLRDFDINFNYQGSILSTLKDSQVELAPDLVKLRNSLRQIRSLELLSPQTLRQSSPLNDVVRNIGTGGEKVSAFLAGLNDEQRKKLLALLSQFYPAVENFSVTLNAANPALNKLLITEQHAGQSLEIEATHLNDGLLRVLAILAEVEFGQNDSLVLLDEVENGINPEITEALVDFMTSSKKQILVTTHSPMVLNYLEDEVAKKSIQLVYKNTAGESRVRPFFSSPRMSEKLEYMAPGEIFVNSDLHQLVLDFCVQDRDGLEI